MLLAMNDVESQEFAKIHAKTKLVGSKVVVVMTKYHAHTCDYSGNDLGHYDTSTIIASAISMMDILRTRVGIRRGIKNSG